MLATLPSPFEETKHKKNDKLVNIIAKTKATSLDRYLIAISSPCETVFS